MYQVRTSASPPTGGSFKLLEYFLVGVRTTTSSLGVPASIEGLPTIVVHFEYQSENLVMGYKRDLNPRR